MKCIKNDIYSKKLRFLRYQLDASQAMMASKLKMCQQAYSKLEKGKTAFTPQKISQICRLFEIREEDFISLDENAFRKTQAEKQQARIIADARIEALDNHYQVLLLESELRNVRLEQQLRNYKPYQETSGTDTPLIYVMI